MHASRLRFRAWARAAPAPAQITTRRGDIIGSTRAAANDDTVDASLSPACDVTGVNALDIERAQTFFDEFLPNSCCQFPSFDFVFP